MIFVCLAMHPFMASATKGDDIKRINPQLRMSRPRFNMVGVQAFTMPFRLATLLTHIPITSINFLDELFPMPCFIKALALWRRASLPCWVFGACLSPHSRRTYVSTRYIELPCKSTNCGSTCSAFLCYVVKCSIQRYILMIQPFVVSIWLIVMKMPIGICPPSVFMAVPFDLLPTTTLAQRWGLTFGRKACDERRWFALLAFSGGSQFHAVSNQRVPNRSNRNVPFTRQIIGVRPCPIRQGSGVLLYDLLLNFARKYFPWHMSSLTMLLLSLYHGCAPDTMNKRSLLCVSLS